MTGSGRLIEVQAGGEEATFARAELDRMIDVGGRGVAAITQAQRQALGERWPLGGP